MRRQMIAPPMPYDYLLILYVLALLLLGLLMVTSASINVSDQELHQPFYYFFRQIVFLGGGCFLGFLVVQFEVDTWEHLSWFLLIAALVALTLVVIPGI